jgi:hypothetical protein
MQSSGLISYWNCPSLIAFSGQRGLHAPQLMHSSEIFYATIVPHLPCALRTKRLYYSPERTIGQMAFTV